MIPVDPYMLKNIRFARARKAAEAAAVAVAAPKQPPAPKKERRKYDRPINTPDHPPTQTWDGLERGQPWLRAWCAVCKLRKDKSGFYPSSGKVCKVCWNAHAREKRRASP